MLIFNSDSCFWTASNASAGSLWMATMLAKLDLLILDAVFGSHSTNGEKILYRTTICLIRSSVRFLEYRGIFDLKDLRYLWNSLFLAQTRLILLLIKQMACEARLSLQFTALLTPPTTRRSERNPSIRESPCSGRVGDINSIVGIS